jgi:hypothetical protein
MYGLTVFPTVGVLQITKLLFLYNFRTEGLTLGEGGQEFDGYSFTTGMIIILFDAIVFTIIGCYLDQVIPTEFGVAKPWNFLCKRAK